MQDSGDEMALFVPSAEGDWSDSEDALQSQLAQHVQEVNSVSKFGASACAVLQYIHLARWRRWYWRSSNSTHQKPSHRHHRRMVCGRDGGCKSSRDTKNAHMNGLRIIFLSGVPVSNQAGIVCSLLIHSYACPSCVRHFCRA